MAPALLFQEYAHYFLNLGPRSLGFLGVVTCLFLIAIKRRYFSPISDIPGPFVASFSIWWQIYHLFKAHTEKEMIKLHREHGPFVRIGDNEVSVCHPDAVKQLLLKPIRKGDWYTIFSLPDYTVKNQMSEVDPKRHIHKSKNVMAGYNLSNVMKSEPYVDKMVEILEVQLDQRIAAGSDIELNRWFNFFAFDALGEVTFSKAFGFMAEGRDVRNAISNTRALAIYVAVMGHFVWFHNLTLGNPLMSKIGIQPTSHIFDTLLETLEARKKNLDVRKDMLEQWLSHRRQYPDRMDESEIFGAAVANIGAGADTTSSSLAGLFYHLLKNPKHLNKLRAEIDQAHKEGKLSRVISYNEAQQLPFLQACIRETYRVHSAAGTGLPRVSPPEGLTIGGRFFPAGTVLSVNPWVFHYNADFFGKDCDEFNPERWLESDARSSQMNHYMIHWGAGYNQCPGRHLAHFEISKVAPMMVRDYEIELVDPKKEWTYETHFTIAPYNWPCKLKRRDLTELI